MTLFPCYDCKKEISLTANYCPNCGSTNPFSTEELQSAFQKNRDEILKCIPKKNAVQECLDTYRETTCMAIIFSIFLYFYLAIFLVVMFIINIFFTNGAISYVINSNEVKCVLYVMFTILQQICVAVTVYTGLFALYANIPFGKNLCFDIDKYIQEFCKQREGKVLCLIETIDRIIPLLDKKWLQTEAFQLIFNNKDDYKESCQVIFSMNKKNIFLIYLHTNIIRIFFYSSITTATILSLLLLSYSIDRMFCVVGIAQEIKFYPPFYIINNIFPILIFILFSIVFIIFGVFKQNIKFLLFDVIYIKDFSLIYQKILDINEKIKT